MTKNTPFPPDLIAISAAAAKASYEAGQETFRKDGPVEKTTRGLAAYRLPSGEVRSAYDLYKPEFPIGAEPGLAEIHYTPIYSVNGYEGYSSTASNFVPAGEIHRPDPLHEPGRERRRYGAMAAALIRSDTETAFLWAIDETQLNEWQPAIPANHRIDRAGITLHGMDNGEAPACALYVGAVGGKKFHVASNPAILEEVIRAEFPNLSRPDMGLSDLVDAIREKGLENGWTVHAQIPAGLNPDPKPWEPDRITELNEEFRERIQRPANGNIGVPFGVQLRASETVHTAAVKTADTDPVLLWAWDEDALDRRVANFLSEITDDAKRFDLYTVGASESIAETLTRHPELELRKGRGGSSLAHGVHPSHLLLVREIAADFDFGISSSSQDGLLLHAKRALAADIDTVDVDDISDLSWKEGITGKFELLHMEPDDLAERTQKLREALEARMSLTPA